MTDHNSGLRVHKGRGAISNPPGRFEQQIAITEDDGWSTAQEQFGVNTEQAPALRTQFFFEPAKTIIARNQSPDIPFATSINPYRGCEHGCVYCYARPSHGYWGLSAGLDFESKIFCKDEAAQLLVQELSAPSYQCQWIALGANTDPYQPIEAKKQITRQLLSVMQRFKQPVGIVTKSHLVTRDIDILADMAKEQLAEVYVSVTTLDNDLKRKLEPRAASGEARLDTIAQLSAAGIPVGVLFAPVIPFINDAELETILARAHAAGTRRAGYVFLRLPYEVKDLFSDWLSTHYPLKKDHVLSLVTQARKGKLNVAEFGERMRGSGQYAELLKQRFKLATKKLGYDQGKRGQVDSRALRTDLFQVPGRGQQLDLF